MQDFKTLKDSLNPASEITSSAVLRLLTPHELSLVDGGNDPSGNQQPTQYTQNGGGSHTQAGGTSYTQTGGSYSQVQ
jgi:hypothetical protein